MYVIQDNFSSHWTVVLITELYNYIREEIVYCENLYVSFNWFLRLPIEWINLCIDIIKFLYIKAAIVIWGIVGDSKNKYRV